MNRILRNAVILDGFGRSLGLEMFKVFLTSRNHILAKLTGSGSYTEYHQKIILSELSAQMLSSKHMLKMLVNEGLFEVVVGEFLSIEKELLKNTKLIPKGIPVNTVQNIISNHLKGRSIEKWIERSQARTTKKIQRYLASSVVEGKNIDEVKSGLKSIFGFTRKESDLIARTATMKAASDSRKQVYQSYKSLVKGYRFVATLDSRTSLTCAVYDGMERENLKDMPDLPLHPRCRSVIVPITDYDDPLERPAVVSEDEKVTRHQDGSTSTKYQNKKIVKTEKSYQEFFDSQPAMWQKQVLGESQYKIYKDNNLSLKDLTNKMGHPYSLTELKKYYSS